MTMLTTARNEMMFCPGCSHAAVLERVAAALDRAGLAPEQVCLVSDIGCIGTADKYFACHTFHGLHGRSLTYAEGVKRRCPELTVVVFIGDGGVGIGAAHLVHAARRGVALKVFVCNNFNFGMTGGQHSPTTPLAARTPTTPGGSIDRPLDIAALSIASGAGFVGRCGALDADFADHVAAALRYPGFAVLDIWELCVAYFMPQNKLTPPKLVELSRDLAMPFGVLHQERPRAPESQSQGATGQNPDRAGGARGAVEKIAATAEQRPATTPALDPRTLELLSSWPGRAEICVAGSAGERIRSAVGVVGELLAVGGLHAAQSDEYPISVRKGHSVSTLVTARTPLDYAAAEASDLLVVQSADGLARLGGLDALADGALIVAADDLPLSPASATIERIALRPLTQAVQRENAALALLAYGVVRRGWLSAASLAALADRCIRGKFRDASLRAIDAGLGLARERGA